MSLSFHAINAYKKQMNSYPLNDSEQLMTKWPNLCGTVMVMNQARPCSAATAVTTNCSMC